MTSPSYLVLVTNKFQLNKNTTNLMPALSEAAFKTRLRDSRVETRTIGGSIMEINTEK